MSTIVRTKALLALPLILVLLGAACGSDKLVTTPTTAASQPTSPGPLPTSSPGGATGTVTAGNATIQLSQGLSGTVQLLMLGTPAVYSPPPGSTALTWTDGLQGLTITGTSFTGPLPTSDSLSLSLSVSNGAETVAFVSTAGECTITVTTAIEGSLAGSFSCANLAGTLASGDALTVDATGTFAATG